MTDDRRRKLLLTSLGVLLVAILAFQLLPSFSLSGSGPAAEGGGGVVGGGSGAAAEEVVELDLELLTRGPGQFTPGRDPFNYGAPPPPPPPPPPSPESVEQDRVRRATAAAEALEQVREQIAAGPPPAQPPPIDVVYLGSFGTAAKRLAVFSDGSDIINATAGSVIKDKFVVVQVGLESADLGFVGFPDVPPERLGAGE